jgi:ribosomal-protein-serine acetyltransferase
MATDDTLAFAAPTPEPSRVSPLATPEPSRISPSATPEPFYFSPPAMAEAGWLVGRRVQSGDTGDLCDAVLASLDHLRPWMPWAESYDRAEAERFTTRHAQAGRGGPVEDAPYVVRDRAGQFFGLCGLHARLGPGALEIGYWIDVRQARRGITTLAAALISELALSLPEVGSVEIHHDQANAASGAIPAKLGYTHVATTRREPAAPSDTGIEWRWLLRRADFPASPAASLLAAARATPSAW